MSEETNKAVSILMERVKNDFSYHVVDENQKLSMECIRSKALELAILIVEMVPYGREQAIAITKLEECTFSANAGIARRKTL